MNDETVKTSETKTKYSSDGDSVKTKETQTEKKTTVEEKPEKSVTVTTVED
jgi:hypothetical protein